MSTTSVRRNPANRMKAGKPASRNADPRNDRPELSDVLSRLSMIIDMERAQAVTAVAFLETALTPQTTSFREAATVL